MSSGSAAFDPGHDHAALSACPIIPVIDMLFSRWTTPILWVLEHHGPQRSTELRRIWCR